ncbi:hypothetical protein NCAS_0D03190 [Naumovozyma castellii]|uniref:DASH complex subunit DUO1 n=1 Tax=Naumovozyma castellii TaxID=27288 RepID=G0VEA9_NAUCA|nr:hypothetical protein NCAS_0D03190 [Naumovozyma castellii CBS 4309]CCC69900.1 hypothetical protein NCAS_0D03190 [Naumovozyma castellii CBS 4309]
MSKEQLDDSTINKLIPQIFAQMRSNFDTATSSSSITDSNQVHRSNITTQSLLNELESLDKIITMVQNLDKTLKNATPKHIDRIHHVCQSTNTILDSWINIQSQAGYINRLMSDPLYLKFAHEQLVTGDTTTADEYLNLEQEEVEKLKRQLELEQQKKHAQQNVSNSSSSSRGREKNSINKSNSNIRRSVPVRSRPSGIPTRLARPTASSSRKMFRE